MARVDDVHGGGCAYMAWLELQAKLPKQPASSSEKQEANADVFIRVDGSNKAKKPGDENLK